MRARNEPVQGTATWRLSGMRMSWSSASVQVKKSSVLLTQLLTSTLGGSWSTTT